MKCFFSITSALGVATLYCSAASATAVLIGPTPYLSAADSPFGPTGSNPVAGLFIEDFEDGLFNAPGVIGVSNTPNTALSVGGGGTNTDSVDGDNGPIDGLGRSGQALSEVSNAVGTDNLGYSFIFDPNAPLGLPTHAGIVWTDGSPFASTQVEFFGPGGISLGIIGPVKISDGSFTGGTAEDHFFGAVNPGGIESFTIRSPGGNNNLTVDHLQYGPTVIPTPTAAALFALAFGLSSLRRRTR